MYYCGKVKDVKGELIIEKYDNQGNLIFIDYKEIEEIVEKEENDVEMSFHTKDLEK